ncbi:MAG: PepSY domain-containing protein [Marinilabiliaceae bacterium]
MKSRTWRKLHKWFGLIAGLFLIMFCWSGVVLNHRDAVCGFDVSRSHLPSGYRYAKWNGGLARGTLRLADGRRLVYGNAGVWVADSLMANVAPLNEGFGEGVDMRNVRSVVNYEADDGEFIYALTTNSLFALKDSLWERIPAPFDGERLTDLTIAADTLLALSRNRLYRSTLTDGDLSRPSFTAVEIPAADGHDGRVTLFRTLWELHSGQLFGMAGRIMMDAVALTLIIIYFVGIGYWLCSNELRRKTQVAERRKRIAAEARRLLSIHDSVGRKTLVLTLFACLTGWCLRPPLMIPAVLTRVPAIPFTSLDDPNPWADKLRAVRYDSAASDFLLSTSEGFYSLARLGAKPVAEVAAPPVSVMGVNVMRHGDRGEWLVGSFRGMYRWERGARLVTDYYDGSAVDVAAGGMPVGEHDVCGWMGGPVEYTAGTDAAPMPEWLAGEPMSLWNVALEVHTGRIYTFLGRWGALMWVFVMGGAAAWSIWTGWKIRRRL